MVGYLKQNDVTSVSRWNRCPAQLISRRSGTSATSQCSSNPCVTRAPSVSKTLPPPVMRPSSPQVSRAALDPLMMMGTVEPEDVSTAEPVTVKLAVSGAPGQVPENVSTAVELVAVKLIVPVTVIGGARTGGMGQVKVVLDVD